MAGHRAKRRPLLLAAAVAALVAAGVWAAIAMAATEDVVSKDFMLHSSTKSTYHSDQGEIPNFVNPSTAEVGSHNVTAKDKLGRQAAVPLEDGRHRQERPD